MSEPEEEDFATLFAASRQTKRLQKGQTVTGRIVAIGADVALVDIGGKGEAEIASSELMNDEGALDVSVGDRIEAVVVSTAGAAKLSRRLALGAASAREVEQAFHSGLPVQGKVERAIKGGYEVRVGRQRGFCPFSQIDILRTADPSQHEGHVYQFRIVEYQDNGRNLVVSRRVLLEEEQRARAEEIRGSIVAGAVVTGRVVSVREFGAFVDLGGGVQGLLHVSEMGWSRVPEASALLNVGDEITVKVLRVDEDGQRISLGLKQLLDDPWSHVPTAYAVGQLRTGRITRVAQFGAFVELEPGVEGLVPVGETSTGHDVNIKRQFPVGSEAEVVILDIDAAARRMRLSINAVQQAKEADEVRAYTGRREAEPAHSVGSLADKLRGALSTRDEP